jgi:hypothetical protein
VTRTELEEGGYKRTSYGKCRGCFEPIEWWLTVNERPAPYDLMPNPESEAVSHYATCPVAERFRKKEPQRCTQPTTQDSLLFSEPSSSFPSSPSSSSATPAQPSDEQPEKKDNAESYTNRERPTARRQE